MLDNGVIFDARIAEKYSVDEAIVINKLFGWIKHNATNGKNFKEGRYWTFNSISAFKKFFPFWNESKIKRILIDLAGCTEKSDSKPKHEPIIIKGNFNKSSFDRTIWYSFTNDFFVYLDKLGYDLNADIPQAENGFSADGQMDIPQTTDQYQSYKQNDKKEEGKPSSNSAVPYEEIVKVWNETCTSLNKVEILGEKRKEKIRLRWKEFSELGDPMQVLNTILKKLQASSFITKESRANWRKNCFNWIFENSENWVKVYEGNYDDNQQSLFSSKPQVSEPRYDDYGHLIKEGLE